MPVLEQRHRDLIGLACVALAVFFAFIIWLDWDGGKAGHGAVRGLKWVFGGVHLVVPFALLAGGGWLVLRPVLPAIRPVRTGLICLFLSLELGLAAGTLGIGPGGHRPDDFDPGFAKQHGGMIGEAMFKGTSLAVGSVGAHIVAVFLFIAAVLLLTGASVAQVIKATSDSVTSSTRRVREGVTEIRGGRREVTEELAVLESKPARVRKKPPPEPEPFEEEPDWAVAEFEAEALEPGTAEQPLPSDDEESEGVEKLAPEQLDLTPQGRYRDTVTDDPSFVWQLPDAAFLKRSTELANRPDTAGQEKTAAALIEALGHFGVDARVIATIAGPHITRYEIRLAPGTKVGKVAQLKDDLAYALAASDIRVLAPIPGKQAVGIEVPNADRRIVHLGDVMSGRPADWSPLTVCLGKDVAGRAISADLAKMPHLLVAGTTGAGKSGCVNAMLSSVLLNATPHEVRMVLVDPKQVELNHYESIPHLLTPVITSPRKAATALQNLVREMEQRYGQMSLARTRSLIELNKVRLGRGEA
ncbi:MAG: segregation ATPase FtsK/SpoIIIE, family, partial [Solirubrobacteraceae bacterium]|nr:segregation ATPase FtsK/SpoIIIE, family [Solirubrobacteraceae bacterium]